MKGLYLQKGTGLFLLNFLIGCKESIRYGYICASILISQIMRKVQLLLLCLLVSVAAFAAEKVIKLPKPNMNRWGRRLLPVTYDQHLRRTPKPFGIGDECIV